MDRRNTIQKKIVLDAILTLKNHPTADEVYAYVVKEYPTISRATVYRNLNTLCEEGVISKIETTDGADRFDHLAYKHYHFMCVKCGKTFDVDMEPLLGIEEKVKNKDGFEILNHDIIFKGICPDCKCKN